MTVKVERVVSGNTIEVVGKTDQGTLSARVRLIGIEAPDLKQLPWGEEARNKLEELINGQQVLLESDVEETDQYDRRLGYIWRDRKLVNEQIVAAGYALAALRSPNTKYNQRLLEAQEFARIMQQGIWNPQNPMRVTPSEFRRQNR